MRSGSCSGIGLCSDGVGNKLHGLIGSFVKTPSSTAVPVPRRQAKSREKVQGVNLKQLERQY